MAARDGDDVPSQEEVDRLKEARGKARVEYESLRREVEGLRQRLESTEQDEEKKKLMKEIDIKDIKRKLANAKWLKAANLYDQRYYEKRRANQLSSGQEFVNVQIRQCKELVVKFEKEIKEHHQRLLEMEQEEELERRNRQLLKERLKQGTVKMRYLVCITIGLPGVGKTCLKCLLMGEPPPELRSSTILSESPIRIEISVQKISEMKIRASGEQWVKVTDSDIMDIVGGLIILASEQHHDSMKSLAEKATLKEPVITDAPHKAATISAPKLSLLQRFLNVVSKGKPAAKASHQQRSLPSSEACRKAVDTIMGKLEEVIKRLTQSSQSTESSNRHTVPTSFDWVLFSDCGGQPKYHELLPLFVHHISAALCVLRLTDNLDKVQPVEYYSEDKPLCLPAQSQLSAKGTIKCLVNTVQSFSTQNQKPKVIFVGTHLDELQKKEHDIKKQMSAITESPAQAKSGEHLETLQEKNNALIDMLESEFSDHLVYFSKNIKELLYPVNTMKRSEEELRMAKLIREAVEKSSAQEVEVPVWWLIFEMLLQELAKLLDRKVLSKAECLELARTLGFGAIELEAVLVYFDKISVIRYSPKVLPNIIFAESQVPLEKVSEYIKKSYILHGEAATEYAPTEGNLKYFRDHGVITRELMSEFRVHYVEDIFKEEDLAALLVERLIFAPIPTPPWVLQPSDDKQSQSDPQHSDASQLPTHSDTASPEEPPKESYYFMASSLMTLTEAELKQHRHSSPSVATLLVKFPKGQRRAGVFCCFASYVICHCGWDIILDAKVPLFRNCIKFHPKRISPPVTVTVIDSDSFIEVHTNISKGATDVECAQLLPILRTSIFAGITAACIAMKYQHTHPELSFFCPQHQQHSLHSASIRPNRLYWCCDFDTTVSDRLEKKHRLWFGKIPDLAEAHASLSTSINRPQASPASKLSTVSTHSERGIFEATDHPPLRSSRTTAASHSLVPPHSYMSPLDPEPGTNIVGDSQVQLPASSLIPPRTQEHLSAAASTFPGSNLPLSTGQHSSRSHLQSTATSFLYTQPSISSDSATYLPEIPDIRSVASGTATSQQNQRHLSATAVSTVPNIYLSSSGVQLSCLSSEDTISAPTSRVHSVQLAADTLQRIPDYDAVRSDVAIEPTPSGDHDASFTSTSPHTPAYSARKPALHELYLLKGPKTNIRIIDKIAHKWDQVAITLHFETHEIEGIERDCQRQTSDASRKMIMKWLNGGSGLRKPITWATLIEALQEADLAELAKDIVSILQESDT